MGVGMIRLAVVVAFAIGFAGRGEAGIVTFEFEGGSGDSAFTGTFWWDQATPDLYPGNPNTGGFQPTATTPWGFSVVGARGSYSTVADTSSIVVATHYGAIEINMYSADGAFFLNYLDGQVWGSDGPNVLPSSLDLSRATGYVEVAVRVNKPGLYIDESGELTSLKSDADPAAVPEPSSLTMAAAGAIGLLAFARRRPG